MSSPERVPFFYISGFTVRRRRPALMTLRYGILDGYNYLWGLLINEEVTTVRKRPYHKRCVARKHQS